MFEVDCLGSEDRFFGDIRGVIADAFKVMLADKKIMLVGTVQSLFEGAMYIFVLQWPPSLINVVANGAVPFGKVFSCFMASCLLAWAGERAGERQRGSARAGGRTHLYTPIYTHLHAHAPTHTY